MIIVGGIMQINPELRQATLDAIQVLMAASRAEEGCIAYTFSQDLASPDTLHLFEVWASAEAFQAHRETPHMAHFRTEVVPTLLKLEVKRYRAEPMP